MSGFGQASNDSLLRYLVALTARRKVFVSYFHGDQLWAQTFVDTYGSGANRVFIPKAMGLNYEDDEILSTNPTYIMGQIRERRIADSSVQIVLIGPCTHSRRYIDWEIKRCLSNGDGLVGILLPPHASAHLPERFRSNWSSDGTGYARYHLYPQSADQLRNWIDEAYQGEPRDST